MAERMARYELKFWKLSLRDWSEEEKEGEMEGRKEGGRKGRRKGGRREGV